MLVINIIIVVVAPGLSSRGSLHCNGAVLLGTCAQERLVERARMVPAHRMRTSRGCKISNCGVAAPVTAGGHGDAHQLQSPHLLENETNRQRRQCWKQNWAQSLRVLMKYGARSSNSAPLLPCSQSLALSTSVPPQAPYLGSDIWSLAFASRTNGDFLSALAVPCTAAMHSTSSLRTAPLCTARMALRAGPSWLLVGPLALCGPLIGSGSPVSGSSQSGRRS